MEEFGGRGVELGGGGVELGGRGVELGERGVELGGRGVKLRGGRVRGIGRNGYGIGRTFFIVFEKHRKKGTFFTLFLQNSATKFNRQPFRLLARTQVVSKRKLHVR
jgi:hypothetical protein